MSCLYDIFRFYAGGLFGFDASTLYQISMHPYKGYFEIIWPLVVQCHFMRKDFKKTYKERFE